MLDFLSPTRFATITVALALLANLRSIAAEAEPPTMSATELATRLSAQQQDGYSYIRLRMAIGGDGKNALQLQIKSRATKTSTDLVYQVLFPKERKGESVLLRKSGGRITGALFTPPAALGTLSSAKLDEPLFGSDLSYEDVIDNFFSWDHQTLVGNEAVDRVTCAILESKPGKGEHSTYSKVRSWIDLRRLVPLRVEKYGESGRLLRRIDTTRVVTDDLGRSVPANISVRGPTGSTTELDGSRLKHGVKLTDADFSAEGLKSVAVPPSESR